MSVNDISLAFNKNSSTSNTYENRGENPSRILYWCLLFLDTYAPFNQQSLFLYSTATFCVPHIIKPIQLVSEPKLALPVRSIISQQRVDVYTYYTRLGQIFGRGFRPWGIHYVNVLVMTSSLPYFSVTIEKSANRNAILLFHWLFLVFSGEQSSPVIQRHFLFNWYVHAYIATLG